MFLGCPSRVRCDDCQRKATAFDFHGVRPNMLLFQIRYEIRLCLRKKALQKISFFFERQMTRLISCQLILQVKNWAGFGEASLHQEWKQMQTACKACYVTCILFIYFIIVKNISVV